MEWKLWSNLPFTQRVNLPNQSGIYVVVDAADYVWYVGKSINLNARWAGKGHHRYNQLKRTHKEKSYKIYWKSFPVSQLNQKEIYYIDLFNPYLNYSRVKSYIRKPIQPNKEIGRLFRVINTKTKLFPDIRSVISGFYTEMDETDEGQLKEFTCIIILINVNDCNLIQNSLKRTHSSVGKDLRSCWKIYEGSYISTEFEVHSAPIPVFLTEDIVYEFVCYPDLLKRLEEDKTYLHNTKLAEQSVLALKDTAILQLLVSDNKKSVFKEENYFHYRIPELRPVSQLIHIASKA